MSLSSSKTIVMMLLARSIVLCFLCSLASAYSSQRPPPAQTQRTTTTRTTTATEVAGSRRDILAGMAGFFLLVPPKEANANAAILSSKYCAYGEGNDCQDLAEGNPYILELQRKSAANKEANIQSAKNAFYAKNYPDWFAAVGKTMVQKESDGTFVVVDNSELAKLWDDGRVKMSTPTTMGGKIKDVTQKPMLVLKE